MPDPDLRETPKNPANPLPYTVRDKSILLPLYKRLFIGTTVPLLPRALSPNTITHAGHIANALGLAVLAYYTQFALAVSGPTRTVAFLFAAAMINFYNWCDNADGAHARHTGQCSAMGELLDHGLDLFNATYIAAIAGIAIGAPPLALLAMVLVVVAAAAVVYWEQAETGTFQLPWLNQIESVVAVTALLAVAAVSGPEVFTAHVGPVSLRALLVAALMGNALLGVVSSVLRVISRRGPLLPFAQQVAFGVAIYACAATGALSPIAAGLVGVGGFVFLGLRHLALRLQKRAPRFELGLVCVTALAFAYASAHASHRFGAAVSATPLSAMLAAAAFGSFAFWGTTNACMSARRVAVLDSRAKIEG